MNLTKNKFRAMRSLLIGFCWLSLMTGGASAQSSPEALQQEVEQLQKQLKATQQQLAATQQKQIEAERALKSLATREEAVAEKESKLAGAADLGPSKITPGDLIPALDGLTIGGAIRANYYVGDYTTNTAPFAEASDLARGEDGAVSLDILRLNADYIRGNWQAKFEYRFYPGYSNNNSDSYSMIHTAWLGYNFENEDQVQVGINRVPFGPGAYGISQSWFFDQHYYIGLADDMDFGVKYSGTRGNLSFDLAYYYSSEGSYFGENFSNDSVRYSYDVSNESGNGYEEQSQFNARVIYTTEIGDVNVDLGASAQFGLLDSQGDHDDGDHYAISIHPVFKWNNWTLAAQLTKYEYDVDSDQPLGTDELVQFGAFDFATLAAAEAWVAGASLSYYHEIDSVDWVDYVIPYVEYSSIMKEESDFNDSDLFVVGAAWGRGGWYIYTELAASNGNDFVGNEGGYGATSAGVTPGGPFTSNRFGENPNDDWQTRFNINFGYYF
jgi:hypothetical protein